ncbi:MAG TPA: hypothetical protein VKU19_18325 [Bryobacteraceae bacterium]|nr:hypothetical protein [Bryobacteraceae bacterium]
MRRREAAFELLRFATYQLAALESVICQKSFSSVQQYPAICFGEIQACSVAHDENVVASQL